MAESVILLEILPQQVALSLGSESRHVREIDAPDLQLDTRAAGGKRHGVLVVFAVAGNVVVLRAAGGCRIDRGVGVNAVHVAVEKIGRPRAVMVGDVAVWRDLAGVRHGHMTEEKDRLHARRIGGVVRLDERLDVRHRLGARDIVTDHLPAIAGEIRLESAQLGGESRGVCGLHHEDHRPARVDERHLDPAAEETVAGVSRAVVPGFDDAVFIDRPRDDVRVEVAHGIAGQRRDRRPPAFHRQRRNAAVNRVRCRIRISRPTQRDARWRRVHRRHHLHGIILDRDGPRLRAQHTQRNKLQGQDRGVAAEYGEGGHLRPSGNTARSQTRFARAQAQASARSTPSVRILARRPPWPCSRASAPG